MKTNIIYNEDCIGKKGMRTLPDKNIDMILADMPYGTTACKWDTIIPLEPMWEQLKRIIKSNGAIVLFGSEPFSSKLRCSNLKMFRYDWIWKKTKAGNFQISKYQPLKYHEIISVFSIKVHQYFPIKTEASESSKERYKYKISKGKSKLNHMSSGIFRYSEDHDKTKRNPSSIIDIKSEIFTLHPTQKPVALFEYLIKTYTNKGEIVLDFAIGSGTTAVACKRLNRKYIGYEINKEYCQIAKQRLEVEKTLWD